jgi:hypothetical protein
MNIRYNLEAKCLLQKLSYRKLETIYGQEWLCKMKTFYYMHNHRLRVCEFENYNAVGPYLRDSGTVIVF